VFFTSADESHCKSSGKDVVINVLKVTPVITWNNPADITHGTALDGAQLNATASVGGSFVYTPAAGTVLEVGNGQTLHVDFTPLDTTNYNTASKDVVINIIASGNNPPDACTITWNNPLDIIYGTPLGPEQLNATASAPGTFVYTPPAGTVLNVGGPQILHVDFTPHASDNCVAGSKEVAINVVPGSKVTPTLTWFNPDDIIYGTGLSGIQLNATASVAGTFIYTPAAGTLLNAGNSQRLHVDFIPDDTANFNPASRDVEINVLKATPMVIWRDPAPIAYGTALAGTQLNATASVTGTFIYTPAAGVVLKLGNNQPLHVDFIPADAANYNMVARNVSINVLASSPFGTLFSTGGICK
jgi:hypothetical protein